MIQIYQQFRLKMS